MNSMVMDARWWRRATIGAAGALMVPMVAMRVTDAVQWTAFDFALAAAMVFGAIAAWGLLTRAAVAPVYRAAMGLALVTAVMLAGIAGALGVIGSERNAGNLMYAGVLLVAMAGAVGAGLRAEGMVRTMRATAIAQVAVAVVALTSGMGREGARWPIDLIGATLVFTALWLAAAALFARAR